MAQPIELIASKTTRSRAKLPAFTVAPGSPFRRRHRPERWGVGLRMELSPHPGSRRG